MVIMMYNPEVCAEFLLPNVHDEDYEIRLYREVYRLQRDVFLKLENSSIGWELIAAGDYRLVMDGASCGRCLLKDGAIIQVETVGNERFQLLVVENKNVFRAMQKYEIAHMKEISIGSNEGNIICYQFRGLVSGHHAVLKRHSQGWVLKDGSTNGTFLDHCKVNGNCILRFGEQIDIFGLRLIFLGNILAVDTSCGELKIKDDILRRYEAPEILSEMRREPARPVENLFHRSPRNLPVIYHEEMEIEGPPTMKTGKDKPLLLTIGPAFTMAIPMLLGCGFSIFGSNVSGAASSAFMYTGLITAVGSACVGVIWAIMNLNNAKLEQEREENQRFNAYSDYLVRIAADLREKYRHNQSAMRAMYPATAQMLSYGTGSSELWNRNRTHRDFLYQRLGLGDMPFQVDIHVPKEKFTMTNDTLPEKPAMIRREFETLHQVPVGISLLEKPLVGLVGGPKKTGAVAMMHVLAGAVAACHCYTDVKLCFLFQENDYAARKQWEEMRWFPHVWSPDQNVRYFASGDTQINNVIVEIAGVLRQRSQNVHPEAQPDKKTICKPHFVLFVSDPSLLEGTLIEKYVYHPRPEYGLSCFLMVENLEDLPNECEDVIENTTRFQGMYNLLDTAQKRQRFTPDTVNLMQLASFAKTLAGIRVKETEVSGDIPASLEFLEMYGVHSIAELNISERWRKNRSYNSMRALIGKKAGNTDCYLDIHENYHGPHGLVAGTTGSGKSETLQTYMLSLAINFSPEDVCFFIIDFKGGGMAKLFTELPHMAGQISNLSGNQIRRAMISLKSEVMRREMLFDRYGVHKIDQYTKLYKNREADVPIPHLLIVIDEFAELKKEEPEFMKELISIAQVGRSLGMHLILATQKPGGTVDDNIWSNSKFRLCLRVQDRQDSNDMLHRPDAAFITQAGRCYMQVGNDEIFELFQSGYSGATYHGEEGKHENNAVMLDMTGRMELVGERRQKEVSGQEKEPSQLQAVIQYLNKVVEESHCKEVMQLWLPLLGSQIYLDELADAGEIRCQDGVYAEHGGNWDLNAVIGMYDDPQQQAQRILKIDFAENGHHAICGSPVSGKSTFLQTLLYSLFRKYSPEELQVYAVDFSSHMLAPFEKAPHVGGIVFEHQPDRLAKLMHMLTGMMDERKKRLRGGNYSQFIKAYHEKLPALLVIIDNVPSFREKTKSLYDEMLLRLAREGVGYGIYLVLTSAGFGMSEIPSRIGDNIRTVISLEQADKFKYMDVLRVTHLSLLPETDVRGRGLAVVDGRVLEFQTALSVRAEDDFERIRLLEDFCVRIQEQWTGAAAQPIPEIPEKPTLGILAKDERYRQALASEYVLPYGYRMQDADIYGMNLARAYCYLISGKRGTGKTNLMKLMIYAACERDAEVCIVEKSPSGLKTYADQYGAEYISDAHGLYQYFSRLIPEFSRRNKEKRGYAEQGLEEEEIYEKMIHWKPIFIFLSDLEEFFKMAYNPGEGVGNMSGFLENIMEKGSLHRIWFVGCLQTEQQNMLSVYRAYQMFAGYKKGIHLGGNLAAQKVFSFQNISFAEQSKAAKKGIGYVPDDEDESVGQQVVVPVAKM